MSDEQAWCRDCELAYDTWSRRNASDIIWPVLGAMVIVVTAGTIIPLLGVPWIFATVGVFAGFGTLVGSHRWNLQRRRAQFLRGDAVPRAYLPGQGEKT